MAGSAGGNKDKMQNTTHNYDNNNPVERAEARKVLERIQNSTKPQIEVTLPTGNFTIVWDCGKPDGYAIKTASNLLKQTESHVKVRDRLRAKAEAKKKMLTASAPEQLTNQ